MPQNPNQFAGKGRTLGEISTRGQKKRYAYLRKEQRGTPVEAFFNQNAQHFDNIVNAPGFNPQTPGRLRYNDEGVSDMPIGPVWEELNTKGTTGKALADYRAKEGKSLRDAHNALIGLYEISYAQDPKAK